DLADRRHLLGWSRHQHHPVGLQALARHPVLPSAFLHSVGAPDGNFSRLNTPPACSPGYRVAVVVAPAPDHRRQLLDHLGRRHLPVAPEEGGEPPAVQGDLLLLGPDQQLAIGKVPEVEAEEVEAVVDVDDELAGGIALAWI
ncbi:MAG TPA: hypothetical protein VLE23_20600, partial [Geminicoccaceae bacterium]|nr:hypothetical protein [Geminicoccaceae bacterium]